MHHGHHLRVLPPHPSYLYVLQRPVHLPIMLSLSALSLALSLSEYVSGASVPTTRQYDELDSDGIMGDEVVRTPGKLRVTENSGICGTSSFPLSALA